jgi:hypothetical protein
VGEKEKRRKEMKKYSTVIFALVMALAFGIGTACAQEVSVGYQGLLGQGDTILNGISVRGWTDQIGYEGTFFYGQVGVDGPGFDADADAWILDGQVMYAPIIKENSKFYLGLDGGYGQYDVEDIAGVDDDFWMITPLLGSEFNIPGLSELGFNFEVGYTWLSMDADDYDLDLSGVSVTAGAHYRF